MVVTRGDMGHREIIFPWRIHLSHPDEIVYSEDLLFSNNCNIRLSCEKCGSRYLILGELLSIPTENTMIFYRLGVLDHEKIEKVSVKNIFLSTDDKYCFIQGFDGESIQDYSFAEDGFTIQCSFVVIGDSTLRVGDVMGNLNAFSSELSYLRI